MSINIGVIGLGNIALKHSMLIKKKYKNIKIISFSRKKIINTNYKHIDNFTNNFQEFLDYKLTLVLICTPTNTHIDYAIQCAKNKIHLFIEKPLSLNLNKVNLLQKIIKYNKLICNIGYVFRHDFVTNSFYNYINKRKPKILYVEVICSSYLPKWRKNINYSKTNSAKNKLGGGVVYELSHEIDYINWFFGKFNSCYANISNSKTLNIDTSDRANLILEKNSKYLVSIHLNFCSQFEKRTCTVFYEDGAVTLDLIKNQIVFNLESKKITKNFKNFSDKFLNQIQMLITKVKKNDMSYNNLNNSIEVLKIIEASNKSNLCQKKIKIN